MVDATAPAPDSTLPDSMPAPGAAIGAGMRARGVDYAALWRQVEAESARVVVVDLERRAIVAGRAMGETGTRQHGETPLERLFPGASPQLERWSSEVAPDSSDLVAHSLSPRQWTYFWRLNPKAALLAVVQHRYGRGAVAAGDTATIRLLCEHWLAPELHAMGIGRAALAPWNRVERRARAGAPRELWGALAAIGLATVCGLWLASGAANPPAAPATTVAPASELQRLTKLSDETLMRSLAVAMSGRDYGEAQEALAAHLALGHFDSAVVLNDRKQVVAHAGLAQAPAVGRPLPAGPPAGAQQFSLTWAGAPIGELLTVQKAAAAVPATQTQTTGTAKSTALRAVGAFLALAGLFSGALLWRHLRARYR